MSTQAEIVAWTCFVVGTVLLLVGVVIGFYVTFRNTRAQIQTKVEEAKQRIEELKTTALSAARADSASEPAAAAAASTAEAAKGTLEQLQGIIAALPEATRFPALLILVGTALMSVATVQFGGHSLF
jgi:predicted histidine transporter YuiF (NhaC family)